MQENKYVEELKKCEGKEVEVLTVDGQIHKGICRAINFSHLNVVLMTDEEKIIVKNVLIIKRKRGNQ